MYSSLSGLWPSTSMQCIGLVSLAISLLAIVALDVRLATRPPGSTIYGPRDTDVGCHELFPDRFVTSCCAHWTDFLAGIFQSLFFSCEGNETPRELVLRREPTTVGPWMLRCGDDELAVPFPGQSRGRMTWKGYCLRRWWFVLVRAAIHGCMDLHPSRNPAFLTDMAPPGMIVFWVSSVDKPWPIKVLQHSVYAHGQPTIKDASRVTFGDSYFGKIEQPLGMTEFTGCFSLESEQSSLVFWAGALATEVPRL